MPNYLTPEELAQQLKVEVPEIMSLIEQGKLRAIRIGNNTRIPEAQVEKLLVICAAVPGLSNDPPTSQAEALPTGSRWCLTRTGTKFRVSGSVADGAEIWPGKMPYPIKFSKSFMEAMLAHFRPGDVAVGGSFDGPSPGSLGEFIQQKLQTKMNPAVYIAALLLEEEYADQSHRRGYICFRDPAFYGNQLSKTLEQES